MTRFQAPHAHSLPGWLTSLVLAAGFQPATVDANIDGLLARAHAAFAKGDRARASALVVQAIEAEPNNPKGYFVRGQLHEAQRQHQAAIADFTHALELDPRAGPVYQHRGGERFRLGEIGAALADFNRAVELVPRLEPHFWQRGIADYYAGCYDAGRRQFELYQTVDGNDVENAAWHFLCVARLSGVTTARASLLKVKEDRRVPMMSIYALFAGTVTAEKVLTTARAGAPDADTLKRQLFYAHFYLGLYYEAVGDKKQAREHVVKAAEEDRIDDYMGDVAKVHADLLRKGDPK